MDHSKDDKSNLERIEQKKDRHLKSVSTDHQLLAIYSKRNSQELDQMITNESIGMEAKKLVSQILKERADE